MSKNESSIVHDLPGTDDFLHNALIALGISAVTVIVLGCLGYISCFLYERLFPSPNRNPIVTRSMIESGEVTPSELVEAGLITPSALSEAAALFKTTISSARSVPPGGAPLVIKEASPPSTDLRVEMYETLPPQLPPLPLPRSLGKNFKTRNTFNERTTITTTTKRSPSEHSMISNLFTPPSLNKMSAKGITSDCQKLSNFQASPVTKKK